MSKAKQVGDFVEHRIKALVDNNHEGAVKATLARLRRGVGGTITATPQSWEATFHDFPIGLAGTGDEASIGEKAAHAALTLFATHQQGKDLQTQLMHKREPSIGTAMGLLAKNREESSEDAIKKRFDQLVRSNTIDDLSYYLRSAVYLLRSAGIPLDYQKLAVQLYYFQSTSTRDGTLMSWGRDFYSQI